MFPYPALLDASRNPFSSRKRVSGRLLPAEQAAEDGGLSGHMRILDTRLTKIQILQIFRGHGVFRFWTLEFREFGICFEFRA